VYLTEKHTQLWIIDRVSLHSALMLLTQTIFMSPFWVWYSRNTNYINIFTYKHISISLIILIHLRDVSISNHILSHLNCEPYSDITNRYQSLSLNYIRIIEPTYPLHHTKPWYPPMPGPIFSTNTKNESLAYRSFSCRLFLIKHVYLEVSEKLPKG